MMGSSIAGFCQNGAMRRIQRSLADAREELVRIHDEFTRIQKRIEAVRDSVANSLVSIFGEQRPAFSGLQEEELIERIAGSLTARLGTLAKPHPQQEERRYIRENQAAAFLGVSVWTLRSWRSKMSRLAPPFTRIGTMVMYSVKELEQYMEARTVEPR